MAQTDPTKTGVVQGFNEYTVVINPIGAADDSNIQAGIDSLEALGRGTLILTAGTYNITNKLTIENDNIEFVLSKGAILQADSSFDPGGNDFLLEIGAFDTALENITIRGEGTFDGNNITSTDGVKAVGIFGATNNIKLEDFNVINTEGTGGVSLSGGYVAGSTSTAVFGTATAGTESTITLPVNHTAPSTATTTTDDDLNGQMIILIAGTGAGQYRWISDYAGATRVITTNDEWDVIPDATSEYLLLNPAKNTTIDGIRMRNFYEGILFKHQYNGLITHVIANTATGQDIVEPVYCVSCGVIANALANPAASNACLDIFDVNIDILVQSNVFSQDTDYGSSTPTKGMTTSNNGRYNGGINITGNIFTGAFNRCLDASGVGISYGNVITNNKFSSTGQLTSGIYLNGATYDLIAGNKFDRVSNRTGGNPAGRAIEVNSANSTPCLIEGNSFSRNGQADIHISAVPSNGDQWQIINNQFTPGDNTLWALRQDVTGIPIYWAGNDITATYVTNELRVDAGTGNIEFGPGNTGVVVVDNEGSNASTTDGATIAHGLSGTPDIVRVHGSVAGEIITATAVDGTNITVAVKQADGTTAGTSQTVYWEAKMLTDNGSI